MAKFSGAVGTFASLGTAEVQASIMKQLGLKAAPISTQVGAREGRRGQIECQGRLLPSMT